jgi:hypothetical protein
LTYSRDTKRSSVTDSPVIPSGTQAENNNGENNLCNAESENPEWGGENAILNVHF